MLEPQPGPATLLKRDSNTVVFPVKFTKFLRTPIFTEHLPWLLLNKRYQTFTMTLKQIFTKVAAVRRRRQSFLLRNQLECQRLFLFSSYLYKCHLISFQCNLVRKMVFKFVKTTKRICETSNLYDVKRLEIFFSLKLRAHRLLKVSYYYRKTEKIFKSLGFSGPYFLAFGLNTDQKKSEYGHGHVLAVS